MNVNLLLELAVEIYRFGVEVEAARLNHEQNGERNFAKREVRKNGITTKLGVLTEKRIGN